ncbi:MAG: hypothetical protein JWP91_2399 [Fibrobacteres bacterium]|nr:hypothetical protein [Fibrobacterota bacterium]
MSLKPYYMIAGEAPKPQFMLKDPTGREYGVVEHYETDRMRTGGHALLEFINVDPAQKARPMIWVDLKDWSVLAGHGKNLPDADFEMGLHAYLQRFPESDRELRRERARQALRFELIRLAQQGYTVAYQEMFPGELTKEDFPNVRVAGANYIVDDQYLIQPGDFRNQVSLVFVEDGKGLKEPPVTALLCNWIFGEGYEILQTGFSESQSQRAVQALVENPELEKIYRERLTRMRREGVLLGIKPKAYSPRTPASPAPPASPESAPGEGKDGGAP